MSEQKGDFLADVPYPSRFHREHAPTWLSAVVTALGYVAPSLAGTRWCEIGCGQGLGACLLAAANPDMRFTGIDINRNHIRAARQLAEDAGLINVAFLESDIADPAGHPELDDEFDFIIAHGLYSWVEDPVRKAIRAFIRQRLAPGGVAYLHYMTHPGSAAFATFHSLFQQMKSQGGTVEHSIEAGLALLSALGQAKAGFFVAHPAAEPTLTHLIKEERPYIAHEYLSRSFAPMHVADVIADMNNAGLHYVGSATTIENIDRLSIPGSVLPVVQQATETGLRETLKDIARNQALRRDLYMRPAEALTPTRHIKALRMQSFCLLPGAPAAGPLRLQTRIGPVELSAELVSPILARLGRGPATFADLERIGNFSTRPGMLNQLLQAMMEARLVHPMLSSPAQTEAIERLNAVLLERVQGGAPVPALAAREIGSAVEL